MNNTNIFDTDKVIITIDVDNPVDLLKIANIRKALDDEKLTYDIKYPEYDDENISKLDPDDLTRIDPDEFSKLSSKLWQQLGLPENLFKFDSSYLFDEDGNFEEIKLLPNRKKLINCLRVFKPRE